MPRKPEILRYSVAKSTNTLALELGLQGAPHGTVVQATRQTGGRGRGVHTFSSPLGGLYFSILLYPALPPEIVPLITLVSGLACAEVIDELAGCHSFLKWPNDLYLESRKLGGILTESSPYSPDDSARRFVVVGIGMNVNTSLSTFPRELHPRVVSLSEYCGRDFDLDNFITMITFRLEEFLNRLHNNDFTLLDRWRGRDLLLGKKVVWSQPDGSMLHGIGKGLLPNGHYLIADSDRQEYAVFCGSITPLTR